MTVKRKSKTHRIKLMAGDWQVCLQTMEGKKVPLFRAFQDRITLLRDAEYKFVMRRMR